MKQGNKNDNMYNVLMEETKMKKRPIVLCIMDGYGISESINGNAVRLANTPNLDDLMAMYPNTTISASGMPVGLPDGQMGNSVYILIFQNLF